MITLLSLALLPSILDLALCAELFDDPAVGYWQSDAGGDRAEQICRACRSLLAPLDCPELADCENKSMADFAACYRRSGVDPDSLPAGDTRWDVMANVIYPILDPTGPSPFLLRPSPELPFPLRLMEQTARQGLGETTEEAVHRYGFLKLLLIRTLPVPGEGDR